MKRYRCVKEVHSTDDGPIDLFSIEVYTGWWIFKYWQFVPTTTARYESLAWQKLDCVLEFKKNETVSSKQIQEYS